MGTPGDSFYLTVDVEEWFHLLDCEGVGGPDRWSDQPTRVVENTQRLLDFFDAHQARGTFFILGWVAESRPALVREIQARGHHLGCHSHHHTLVWSQTPESFRIETRRALHAIEDASGTAIRTYRAPGFSITQQSLWAFRILCEEGIEADASVFPGTHAHGGLGIPCPDTPYWLETTSGRLLEFPMSMAKLGPLDLAYAGGGYFRSMPWPLIKYLVCHKPYTMSYFHPRDFDPLQPRLEGLSMARHWKSYTGLKTALPKLGKLLALRKGIPIRQEDIPHTAPQIQVPD
jgi:polysaccharide deacetylase family protein (PEP-CTERM system associated)